MYRYQSHVHSTHTLDLADKTCC